MKKLFLAAMLLLGMSTHLFAQNNQTEGIRQYPTQPGLYGYGMYSNDELARKAVLNARLNEMVRGFRIAFDGGTQHTLKYEGQSFNNSRFNAEFGYRLSHSSYIGVSIGVNKYTATLKKGESIEDYDGSKLGMPLSLIYRAYLFQRFASPYAYLRGTKVVGKIDNIDLGIGVGVEINIAKGASIFAQAGLSGMGFIHGEGFFKSRLQAGDDSSWDKYGAGPLGDISFGVRIPLSYKENDNLMK
jgi:hypothetical protein